MGSELPAVPLESFANALERACRNLGLRPPEDDLARRLHLHYEELKRWNPAVALVGPGMAAEAIGQHYAESLAGLSLLPAGAGNLVDVGSGAGFPGLILAAASSLDATLIEIRERKSAFLAAAARRMALRVSCLNARVEQSPAAGLPAQVHVVTMRAVRLSPSLLSPLLARLSARGRLLLWRTAAAELPGFVTVDEVRLDGARRILALEAHS